MQLKFSYITGGVQNDTVTWETVGQILIKLSIHLPDNPAVPYRGIPWVFT